MKTIIELVRKKKIIFKYFEHFTQILITCIIELNEYTLYEQIFQK